MLMTYTDRKLKEKSAACLLCNKPTCSCVGGLDYGKLIKAVRFDNISGAYKIIDGKEQDFLKYAPEAMKACRKGKKDRPVDIEGLVEALIEKAKTSEADYIGYRINNTPSIKTHFGFWGEYVTLDTLKRVAATTDEKLAHEHVTIHIYTHPDEYKCEWIECPDFLQGRNDIRLTVDNPEDFENAQKAFASLYESNPNFGLEDVVEYIDSHNDMRESMKKMIENNQK
jgi:spore coat polysaccharide biosynthesis protein SpsF (cytidylyltransferase family)